MSRIRVYIKPFREDTTRGEFTEVTNDVIANSIGIIKKSLDINEFDVGVFKNSDLTLKLRNDHGKYNDVEEFQSIFKYKRSDSLVKITWDRANYEPICGLAVCGSSDLSDEIQVFQGILNDAPTKMNANEHVIDFKVLGLDSIFDQTIASDGDAFSNGDLVSDIIYAVLNQTRINEILHLEATLITPKIDIQIDDVSIYAESTVREILNDLLLLSNSILYIDSNLFIRVKGRTASTSPDYTFYGPDSQNGRENIFELRDLKSGTNRLFNFLQWGDTSIKSVSSSSVTKYGYKKKRISSDSITTTDTKNQILTTYRDEFESPKKEFTLVSPLNYDTLALDLLSRLSIDFPAMITTPSALPIYEQDEYDVARYPSEFLSFSILPDDHVKVIGLGIDLKNEEISYNVRRV